MAAFEHRRRTRPRLALPGLSLNFTCPAEPVTGPHRRAGRHIVRPAGLRLRPRHHPRIRRHPDRRSRRLSCVSIDTRRGRGTYPGNPDSHLANLKTLRHDDGVRRLDHVAVEFYRLPNWVCSPSSVCVCRIRDSVDPAGLASRPVKTPLRQILPLNWILPLQAFLLPHG